MREDLRETIASRGYWRVLLRPVAAGDVISSLQAVESAIFSSVVRLRGWPYPYASNQRGLGENAIERHEDYVTGWIDWEQHREFWNMYLSSQYIGYRALHDDWRDRSALSKSTPYDPDSRQLSALGTIFQITEFFAFLERLGEQGFYSSGVAVDISLRNCGPRTLQADATRQIPFLFDKITHAERVSYQALLLPEEVANVLHNSIAMCRSFFDKFGWNPPVEQLSNQIEGYLAGRI